MRSSPLGGRVFGAQHARSSETAPSLPGAGAVLAKGPPPRSECRASERLPRTHLDAKVRKRGVEDWNPGLTLLWALVPLPHGPPNSIVREQPVVSTEESNLDGCPHQPERN